MNGEVVFKVEAKAEGAGLLAGVGDGEAAKVGDRNLATVDGETHGDEGGDEGDHQHGEGAEDDVEDTLHGPSTGYRVNPFAESPGSVISEELPVCCDLLVCS